MSEIASIRQSLMRARAFLEIYDRGVIEIPPEKAPVIERVRCNADRLEKALRECTRPILMVDR